MLVRVTETAEQDILETLHFFRAPSAMGDSFQALVAEAGRHLRQWPYTGHRRPDLTDKDVCFWTEGNYLFVLAIRGEELSILAVLHSKRDVAKILRKRLRRPS